MKTLSEIIEICRSGGKPDIDDARIAICAMDILMTFDSTHLMRMAQRENEGKNPLLVTAMRSFEDRFNRVKKALSKSPLEWLGDNNNPDNPEVQRRRDVSKKLVSKITAIQSSK